MSLSNRRGAKNKGPKYTAQLHYTDGFYWSERWDHSRGNDLQTTWLNCIGCRVWIFSGRPDLKSRCDLYTGATYSHFTVSKSAVHRRHVSVPVYYAAILARSSCILTNRCFGRQRSYTKPHVIDNGVCRPVTHGMSTAVSQIVQLTSAGAYRFTHIRVL